MRLSTCCAQRVLKRVVTREHQQRLLDVKWREEKVSSWGEFDVRKVERRTSTERRAKREERGMVK